MVTEKGVHVLVVEDEPLAAGQMARYLEAKGYRASTVGDGLAGLRVHRKDPADIVVTDLRMPHLDGYEFIRELRRDNPDLPIIVVTGHMRMEGGEEEQTGAAVVLKKPINLRELAQTVERMLKKTRP
ncbi:MAG: response regulator [Proteobacteria bacterium]|nr:response regulator [Pseudomonadota bacterium]